MGEEGETILEYLPVSLETLMAIELAATVVLSGMLLMDLLNVTHTTKFFSPETLPKALKYIFISIISGLLVFSIYLFALGGSIRAAALLSDGGDVTSVETVQSGIITTPDSTDHLKIPVQEEENQDEFPEEYTSGLKMLLIGIPAVSSVSGIFGAIGLLPFLSMLSIGIIAVPLFVICGGLWIVGQLLMRYVTLFYNFALSVLDIFIGIGEWIGRAVRNFFGQGNTEADHGVEVKTTDRDNREMPVESATNNTPAPADNEVDVQNAEEHGNASGTISDEMQPSTINDKDWNPLV
ncbi:MAG: hypothetical protein HZA14_13155 [Nitrospirae bacterium]|nr:hypothetical protein [Nitrospirota bacterium]